jgi:3-phosphoshikimate 1-carboxyvinyltransferase
LILHGPLSGVSGRVEVPGSKSLTNRALVAAAVAGGGVIEHPLRCDDTVLLADALASCGWPVEWGESIRVDRRRPDGAERTAWLGESGTGSRLMVALLAATPGRFVVDGSPRLRERPMAPLIESLRSLGAVLEGPEDRLPLSIAGRNLAGGRVRVRPEVSSQFVSALMLAAPLMSRGLAVEVDGPLPSRPYVDLTVDVLRQIGIDVTHCEGPRSWTVAPSEPGHCAVTVEGDWSAAAFFIAAVAVAGGRVAIEAVRRTSRQGDRVMCDIVAAAGVNVAESGSGIVVGGALERPIEAHLEHAPDLFPALAAAAATAAPGSKLHGLEHLKHKESDRLSVMVGNLRALGAVIEVEESTMAVLDTVSRMPDTIRSVTAADDHRIAMAMAVTALRAGPLKLDNPDCVAKSFPGFWESWRSLIGRQGAEHA